ncbi:MAG: ATP-binding protein [Cyanobacteria bacterium P01_F01_bin.153]
MDISLRSTLIVPSRRDALSRVLSWAECFRGKPLVGVFSFDPISNEVWLRYKVALAEGFTNVVRHAHEGLLPETPVELQIQLEAQRLALQIWDSGPPFDFKGKLERVLAQPRRPAAGGFGLVIMYRAADEWRYERGEDERNCLTLVWNLKNKL